MDAGAVDQRPRQRRASAASSRSRGRATPGRSNSRENQLTPWSNDPVSDPPGEALFLRDEETGEVWSPTPLPIRDDGPYVVRHGQGYSRFEHEVRRDRDRPDRVRGAARIRSRSRGCGSRTARGATRRLTVTAYVEWVLGPRRGADAPFIVTELDARDGRPLRPQRLERDASPGASLSPTSGAGRPPGRPIGPSFSAETEGWTIRRALRAGARSRAARAPVSTPARRSRSACALAPGQTRRGGVPARPGPRRRRGPSARRRATARGTSTRARGDVRREWEDIAHGAPGAHAGPLDGPHAEPLAPLPDARLPHPGARRPSTRPGAPRDSATSCRT